MGDFLSKSSKSFDEYKPTGQSVSHLILGDFPILQNPLSGQSVLQKRIDSAQLAGCNKSILRTHLALAHPNIIRFEGYEQINTHEYLVYFENFDFTLKQEIQKRASTNTRFTEKEIITLVRDISAALSCLQENRIVHGQIRTETLVKVESDYKILNMTIFGSYKSTYQLALEQMRKTQIRLLSPQLQDALYNKIVDPVHEGYKDDVYAFGVVLLDAMTLCVDTGVSVGEKLAKASKIYSKTLISLINKMLENIMSLRLDCISCRRVIENIYVQKDVIPRGLYPSRFLQRESMTSPNKEVDPEQLLATGVSIEDIKRCSPSYKKSERTTGEQGFSPAKNYDAKEEYVEPSYGQNPVMQHYEHNSDLVRGSDYLQPTEPVKLVPLLAKSYNTHEDIYQTPNKPSATDTPGGTLLNLKPVSTESGSKERYQTWESNSTFMHSQDPYLHGSGYQAGNSEEIVYNPSPTIGKDTNLLERNLSPLIKNDPLLL